LLIGLLTDPEYGGDMPPERRDLPELQSAKTHKTVYFTATALTTSNPEFSYSFYVLRPSYRIYHVLANKSKHFPMENIKKTV
jgi:hypothetical protein